jgi:dynein regulatory complex protein 1
MEDMKAVYRLNEEKLEFNTRVLEDRKNVNSDAKKRLKNREQKYKDALRAVRDKFEAQTRKYAKDNRIMTKDYKKFTMEFLLLQKKYERFENSDKKRFNEIWSMNQNEVMALCEKIKDCDRVIHIQQLGIPWQPPSDPIFNQYGQNPGANVVGQSLGGQNTSVMDSSKHGVSKSEFVDDG